jgi:polysaccharide chain length determinant protein (PEP-CTERM system associated)
MDHWLAEAMMKPNSNPMMERVAEYRSILVYRWRSIVAAWILLSAVLLIGVQLVPNTYQASTTILAYPRKVPEKYVSATVVDDSTDRLTLLQQEILSSTRLIEVMRRFGLYQKLIAAQGREVALTEMRKEIKIQTSRGGGGGAAAFTLTFSNNDPKVVANVANELANSFILKNLSNREQQVQGTTSFISDQLDQARTDLQRQEEQLRIFRMGHLGEMPDQVSGNLQAIGQLQAQFQSVSDKLAQLEAERLLIENAPETTPALRASSAPSQATVLETQLNQERARLADLLSHVTPEHPDAIAAQTKISQLEDELSRVPKTAPTPALTRGVDARLKVLDDQRSHLLSEQSTIRTRLNSYQNKVDAVPIRQEQLSALTRDYDTAKEHYRSLLEKYYAAQMAGQLEEKQDADRFEVLDPAVEPEHPAKPNRAVLRLSACLMALAGSFMLAFGLERLDGTIKSDIDLLKILPSEIDLAGSVSNIPSAVGPRYRNALQAV